LGILLSISFRYLKIKIIKQKRQMNIYSNEIEWIEDSIDKIRDEKLNKILGYE